MSHFSQSDTISDFYPSQKFKNEIEVSGHFVFPPWGEIWGKSTIGKFTENNRVWRDVILLLARMKNGSVETTGPPLPELSPRIVNTSGYIHGIFVPFRCQGKGVKLNHFHALPKRSASVRAWHKLHNAKHQVVLIKSRA